MATKKVSFASMKLKVDDTVTDFDFEGTTISVKKYLPINSKLDLVQISLQQAYQDGIYNELALEVSFNVNLVYLYTNINFTDKQKEDPYKLYDELVSSGLLTQIISHMDQDEYKFDLDYLETVKNTKSEYHMTTAAGIKEAVDRLPNRMKEVENILNNFNPENFKQAQRLAQMANADGMNNK